MCIAMKQNLTTLLPELTRTTEKRAMQKAELARSVPSQIKPRISIGAAVAAEFVSESAPVRYKTFPNGTSDRQLELLTALFSVTRTNLKTREKKVPSRQDWALHDPAHHQPSKETVRTILMDFELFGYDPGDALCKNEACI